jgi:hypothetical protein
MKIPLWLLLVVLDIALGYSTWASFQDLIRATGLGAVIGWLMALLFSGLACIIVAIVAIFVFLTQTNNSSGCRPIISRGS